ncbi:MAG: carboxypeptidase-like regulatory domain-containing protein [Bacteroidota bacterium]
MKRLNPTLEKDLGRVLVSIIKVFASHTQSHSSLSGIITNERSEPVPGITVLLKGTNQNQGVIKDIQGKYIITNIQPGAYTLPIYGVSYEKREFQSTLNRSQNLIRSITLKESRSELDKVMVTAKSEAKELERSAKAVQVMETMEVKLKATDLEEVLAQTERVNVRHAGDLGSNPRFSLNGLSGDQIRFFYDGILLDFTPYDFEIANVPINIIDRVEIYKSVVPIQFEADALGGTVNLASPESCSTGNDLLIEGAFDPALDKGYLFDLITGLEYTAGLWDKRLQNIAFVKNYRQNICIKALDPSVEETLADKRSVSNYSVGNGLKFIWSPCFSTKLNYEYTYRLSNHDEIFRDGQLVLENLELQPENSHNVNLQWSYTDAASCKTDLQLRDNVFMRQIDDLIFSLMNQDNLGSFQNVWSATSQRIELSRRYEDLIKGLTLLANTTYHSYFNTSETAPFVDFKGDRIPNTSYLFANGAKYELKDTFKKQDRLFVFWNIRYINSFFVGWESADLQQFKAEVSNQTIYAAGITHRMQIKKSKTHLRLKLKMEDRPREGTTFEIICGYSKAKCQNLMNKVIILNQKPYELKE